MRHIELVVLVGALLALSIGCMCSSNADLVNAKVERTIDLTGHVVNINHVITVENKATSGSLSSYMFVVEPAFAKNVAFVGAHLNGASEDKLVVTQVSGENNKGTVYRIDLKSPLNAGSSLVLEIQLALFSSLKPFPEEITQTEKQLVVYKGNHYYYSLYATKQQKTVVNLASNKIESYSQLKPTAKADTSITYGPYENTKPFEQSEMSVHYENNSPFLTVTNLVRTIEVSHWGNIAIEETIDIVHAGAKLKGSFSRFDHMRRIGGAAAVNSFKMLLPPAASDVYYRDEIGNISTSNLRKPSKLSRSAEPVDLELKPRFPLFGGWRTHYTIGYNLPSYQYLFTKGNDFALKMRLIDHVFDDQYIESATIRIILPEFVSDIEFVAPYAVERSPDEKHFTYLDTVGRTVVVVQKKNSVDNHIQDFQIKYKFQKALIVQEPLLLVAGFFVIFFAVMVIVRLDFSLSPSQNEHAKKE